MTDDNPILADVEAFIASTPGMSMTRLGTEALGDPRFVPQLRDGRRIWPETERKVRAFMDSYKPKAAIQ
jgi:hypothetical protein